MPWLSCTTPLPTTANPPPPIRTGAFRLVNIPPDPYHLEIKAANFAVFSQDVAIRNALPVEMKAILQLAEGKTTVTVEASGAAMLEVTSSDHTDSDRSLIDKLPSFDPGGGLSQAITYTTGGVVADSNGFFHPQGDHAQTSYVVDGQPISDQQSKAFSTQMPENAFQNMEMITGSATAQYGDKTSLVVEATTRSGLGKKPFGEIDTTYGSFGTVGEQASVGFGSAKVGDFIVIDTDRSGRFLDSPEFDPMHDVGNDETIFDRFDFQPGEHDAFHLNLFAARNWFQIPDTYDQAGQDQRQQVTSFNIAPGYQHTFGSTTLLTVNPWVRRDFMNYYPSRNPYADDPATLAQDRHLLNYGHARRHRGAPGRAQSEDRNGDQADAAVRRFLSGHHGPHLQPDLRGCQWQRGRAVHRAESRRAVRVLD